MTENENTLYEDTKLTPDEIAAMPAYLAGRVEFYDTPAFQKLYEYFAFETCEMPYGIAKARSGDPDLWILEHIDNMSKSRST